MASKKGFIVVIILIVIGGGAYWWLNGLKTGAEPSENGDGSIPGEVTTSGMADTCGNDLACGNRILTACTPGSFTGKTERLEEEITVLGKGDVSCKITASRALAALEPFGKPALDVNKDGKLEMACDVPPGLDFARLTKWLQGAGINGCEGELREYYDSLGS